MKKMFHPIGVERPNPQDAVLPQEQLDGRNGELKAAMQYMSQSFRIKDQKIKDLSLDIAAEQRLFMNICTVRLRIKDTRDHRFLLNREEAHNAMFREAFNQVQDTGSNQDFGVTKALKIYFDLSSPSPKDGFGDTKANPPSFNNHNA